MHREGDVGQSKASSAARAIREYANQPIGNGALFDLLCGSACKPIRFFSGTQHFNGWKCTAVILYRLGCLRKPN
jgi:hypothetical protein